MANRKIQFSLVYRDMYQSYGKFQPRKDQLERIAPVIIKMGCFARVETNGGAFEQVNLLYGENPNDAVRAFTKPFNEVGIKTHMLDRGLNALRMFPCADDLRQLQYKVKHAQGVDITRIFCGLNDVRNIIPSIKWALEAGMTPQATLCITNSPIHTAEYYSAIADELIAAGAPEICLKDMAGIGQPALLGKLCGMIKKNHPEIIVEYHGHNGPGLVMASILEVCKNGADIIDVAMEPLSWGKGHADIISVQSMLKHYGFDVPEINMNAYMEARALTQEFIDDFLGYFINPQNHFMTSLLLGCGLPGGMMGSMMADLKGAMSAINANREKKGEAALTDDEILIKLFDEVSYVWPRVGYPPLVTPFSQYVKNIALMNLLTESMDKPRFSMMDENMWGMILGKSGKLPGPVAPEIVKLAEEQGKAKDMTSEEAAEVARRVGLASLKYFILKVDPRKNMVFNPEESIDFNGNTGSFIQYTYARIRSVLRKAKEQGIMLPDQFGSLALSLKEQGLIAQIASYPEIIAEAAKSFSPAIIANYVYELVKEYNQFYHEFSILKEEDTELRAFRLALSEVVARTIASGMELLGIEMVERM